MERTSQTLAAWKLLQIDLVATLGKPGLVRLRFVASDLDGNSLVEAAVDDITFLAAPGANEGRPGRPRWPQILLAPSEPGSRGATVHFVSSRAGDVKLGVYDVRGRLVCRLLDGWLAAGPHQARWDGRDGLGLAAAHGTYFVHLESPDGTATRKAPLLP